MHYQTFRSVFDVHVFVLCYAGSFYERVPADVRKQGPWQGNRRGAVANLKPEYRLPAARDGYALVRCEHAVFKPEEWLFQEVTGRLECGRDAQLRQEVSLLWGNDGVWLVLADEEQEAHGLQRLRDRNVFGK
jgi:hypothetical protein